MLKRNLLSKVFVALLVIAGSSAVFAQERYRNVYSRTDVSGFIQSLENSSDVFSRDFRSTSGTTVNERRIVTRFENAVDQLRRNYNRGDNWWNSRNDVQGIMSEAQQVNSMMNNERFVRRLEQQWRALRRDINKLADTYELPELQGGGGGIGLPGGGLPGMGGPTSRPPAWAQGTFYSTSGPQIIMTIDNSGRISLNNQGQVFYGRYNRGQMFLNNDVSTVSRSGNGITTYNRSTGQTTFYSRDGYGGGVIGGGVIDGGGPTSRPPNWLIGTFYANGADLQMTISNNGRIMVTNQGQGYVGRYYNGQIYLNNDVSTVTRQGRGIRTYNQSSGQTTDYRRQ